MADESREASAELTQATKSTSLDTHPIYEIGYHLVPTIAEADVAVAANKVRKMLGTAEVIKDEAPRKLTLAYVIERPAAGRREKYAEAYFGFIKFATDKENINALEQALRANREVLRYLLVETVREDAQPRRTVFTSDRLEGETIHKPKAAVEEKVAEVSEEELNKSIDAIVI